MNPTPRLGGPGPDCSRLRLQRLAAGELPPGDADALRAHVATCLRCQAAEKELARERAELARVLPFDRFAAGVAERLAEPDSRRRGLRHHLPIAISVAAAAGVAALALPGVFWPSHLNRVGNRVKGAASAAVFVKDAAGTRALGPGDPAGELVAEGAQLLVSLQPAGARYAAAALWEKGSVSMLYAGEAHPGPLPTAFEWDGHGRAALVVRFSGSPVDTAAFVAGLQRDGPDSSDDEATDKTWVLPLRRP